MSLKSKEMANHTTPDSTTKEKMQFTIGDEVLLQRKDGNFYLGTVVEIDCAKEMCLVKFGDNTQSWSTVARLTKLSTGFDVMCVKCKSSQSKKDNDILVCDRCSRGYHQLCHSPHVKAEDLAEGSKWECCRCEELPDKRYLPLRKSSSTLVQVPPSTQPPPTEITKLPYKLSELEWDVQHRVNKSNKYCYCGGGGKWFLRMLQCGRCRQWFHTKCISSLNCPVFFGDRFFVFVCTLCNNGKEFIRRLEIKWVDIIHLTIFHLTLISSKKYLHVDNDILKFMNSNWKKLQLPKTMEGTDVSDRKDKILNILTGNRNRFKNSREVAKRTTMWGLRIRVPPPPPAFNLPPNKPLTDTILSDAFSNNPRLKFFIITLGRDAPIDHEWDGHIDTLPGISLLHLDKNPIVLSNGVTPIGHNVCIKSSAPRSEIERRMKSSNDFRSRKARKLLRRAMTKNKNGKVGELPPTPPSSESNPEAGGGGGGAGMDTSGPEDSRPASPCTLDAFIPPPTDFEGSNNPFHSFPLSLAPTQRIVPTKRRLSEKDIRITSNGEVKRRRVRRRKLADPRVIPRHTPTTSPVKTPPPISLQQLKTSVNHFFGAINRIAAGEKFKVRAKRVSSDGKVQYLIDWGGSPT